MSLFKEFRDFAMRGNVVDLAVGVIIGAAFGKIVSSLVANIIMPPLGLLIGGVDFKQFKWVLKPAEGDIPAVVMEYGNFIQTVFVMNKSRQFQAAFLSLKQKARGKHCCLPLAS